MQQKCPVGRGRHAWKVLENRASWLSHREVISGHPDSGAIGTPTTHQGACVLQLQSQGIVVTQGTGQGTKQTQSLPHGAPSLVEEQGQHISRDCVCSGLDMLISCILQTDSVK